LLLRLIDYRDNYESDVVNYKSDDGTVVASDGSSGGGGVAPRKGGDDQGRGGGEEEERICPGVCGKRYSGRPVQVTQCAPAGAVGTRTTGRRRRRR